MRAVSLAAGLALAGCGFTGKGGSGGPDATAPNGDGDTPDDGGIYDASPINDGPPLDGPTACAAKRWEATFATDPTLANLNGDAVNDWTIRGQAAPGQLPGSLANGVWSIAAANALPLDTNPLQDFGTFTRATVRMRNTARSGPYGAVFWINVDYSFVDFAAIYASLQRDADGQHQTLTLFHKPLGIETALRTIPGLATDFVEVGLAIDPASNAVQLTVDGGAPIALTYGTQLRGFNNDRYGTVLAYGADAEFDLVRIDVCP